MERAQDRIVRRLSLVLQGCRIIRLLTFRTVSKQKEFTTVNFRVISGKAEPVDRMNPKLMHH